MTILVHPPIPPDDLDAMSLNIYDGCNQAGTVYPRPKRRGTDADSRFYVPWSTRITQADREIDHVQDQWLYALKVWSKRFDHHMCLCRNTRRATACQEMFGKFIPKNEIGRYNVTDREWGDMQIVFYKRFYAARIKMLLKRNQLTPEEMAELIDIPVVYMKNILMYEALPLPVVIARIRDLCGPHSI